MESKKVALLIFSRTADSEANAKPLAKGKHASKAVATFNINHVRNEAAITKLPVLFISDQYQRGTTFGERFANAFQDIFDQGYEKVIALGNDCLSISAKDILTAVEILEDDNCVIGPSPDGGAYLIGIHKSAFQKQAFCDIYWQSAFTLSNLKDYFGEQKCDTILLSEKADIDTISDWNQILKTVSISIRKQVLILFALGKKTLRYCYTLFYVNLYLVTTKSLRAPPYCI